MSRPRVGAVRPPGPAPEPAELHALRGSKRRRDAPMAMAPRSPGEVPDYHPSVTTQIARARWRHIWTNAPWISEADTASVVRVCILEDLQRRLWKQIHDEGLFHKVGRRSKKDIEDGVEDNRSSYTHSLLSQWQGVIRDIRMEEAVLGLTPADRARLRVEKEPEKGNPLTNWLGARPSQEATG